jgi:hypothetical protein
MLWLRCLFDGLKASLDRLSARLLGVKKRAVFHEIAKQLQHNHYFLLLS